MNADNRFADWSDDDLRDYEESLYDREVGGEDVWFERNAVLWEMNRRTLTNKDRPDD